MKYIFIEENKFLYVMEEILLKVKILAAVCSAVVIHNLYAVNVEVEVIQRNAFTKTKLHSSVIQRMDFDLSLINCINAFASTEKCAGTRKNTILLQVIFQPSVFQWLDGI